MVAFHELVTILALGLVLGAYVVTIASYGIIGATMGGAVVVSLSTFAVVGGPHLPGRWDFPTLRPRWTVDTGYVNRRPRPSTLVTLLKRYRVAWALITLLLYVAAVPFTIVVFPENSLWLGLLILFSGFTASLTTLADLLVNAEDSKREDVAEGQPEQ